MSTDEIGGDKDCTGAARAYSRYLAHAAEAAQSYAEHIQDAYGRYRKHIEEVVVPLRERMDRMARSWNEALREVGNGDDSVLRAATAWMEHRRQYVEAMDEYQRGAAHAAKTFVGETSEAYTAGQSRASEHLATYFGELQQLLSTAGSSRD